MNTNNLYTATTSYLVVLDSRNATQILNGSFLSDVVFHFQLSLRRDPRSILWTCSVMSFTSPNSIYVINEYNNILSITISGVTTNYTIVKGNYNANTFITYLLSILPAGFTLTINTITNKFTLGYTAPFSINANSTIYEVMGFLKSTVYNSVSNNIIMPFTCNFNGLQNLNIYLSSTNTENLDSFTQSTGGVIQTIPIVNGSNQILFQKTNNFEFIIKQEVMNTLEIELLDDLENPINFNNQHWNLTLKFTTIKDVDRFSYKNNFENILGSSTYDNFDNYDLNEKNKHYDSLNQYHDIIKHNKHNL